MALPYLFATHPGETLREDILPALGMSKVALARSLKIGRQHLYDLLNEARPVTPQMALRLGKAFGNSPEFWLRMQQNYDLAIEREAMAAELAEISVLQAV